MEFPLNGFVVKEIDMTRPSRHEHINDTLRLPWEMRNARQPPILLHSLTHRRTEQGGIEHGAQGSGTDAVSGAEKKLTAGFKKWIEGFHGFDS